MLFLRKWSTPLTIGSFVLMSVTGVLMFFHWNIGVNKLAHEWLSWAFLAGVALHVATNWLVFSRYFKSPLAITIMALFAVALGLSFLPLTGPKPESPVRTVMATLGRTPIAELAPLVQSTPDAVIARLNGQGFKVTSPDQTPEQIVVDRKKTQQVLGVIFARDDKRHRPAA